MFIAFNQTIQIQYIVKHLKTFALQKNINGKRNCVDTNGTSNKNLHYSYLCFFNTKISFYKK